MGLIALPHIVTVKQPVGLDRWGLLQSSAEEVPYKARVRYQIEERIAGKTTGQPVKNIIVSGQMILEVDAKFSHDTVLTFTAKDGKKYEVIPKQVKPISDFNARPIYWKVIF